MFGYFLDYCTEKLCNFTGRVLGVVKVNVPFTPVLLAGLLETMT